MREDTTPTGYDQPRTDPIPQLGDEPETARTRPDQAGTPYGTPPQDADPQYEMEAEPVDHDDPDLDARRAEPAPGDLEPEPGFAGQEAAQWPPDAAGPPAGDVGTEPGPAGAGTGPAPADAGDTGAELFGGDDVERFRGRWRELQADFVDDPMRAVRGADQLVDEVMRTLSEIFAAHKHELEGQWQGGGTGETEELRVALRRYRSFFDQLLNA